MVKAHGVKTMETKHDQRLTEKPQNAVVKSLRILLADESVLYRKLRNYYWNITGVNFYSLHLTFENQLDEIAVAMDEVTKCIHQYRSYVQLTIDEFVRTAHLSEELGVYPDACAMVANLAADHETIIRYLHENIKKIGDDPADVGVADVLTSLLHQHEKMVCMLWMHLES